MRPEEGAVLALTPALGLESARLSRRPQGPFGQARGPILRGVEAREVLAENLGGRVALEPLSAGIPARHDAVDVEHVDRIVGDRLDQEPVAVLRLRGPASLRCGRLTRIGAGRRRIRSLGRMNSHSLLMAAYGAEVIPFSASRTN